MQREEGALPRYCSPADGLCPHQLHGRPILADPAALPLHQAISVLLTHRVDGTLNVRSASHCSAAPNELNAAQVRPKVRLALNPQDLDGSGSSNGEGDADDAESNGSEACGFRWVEDSGTSPSGG